MAKVQETKSEILIYKDKEGPQIEVSFDNETVWLSQEQIAAIFGTKRPAITKHLNNIFKSGELNEKTVCSILEHTATDNKVYKKKFYNLDAVISIGYRVNSKKATQFRVWATERLRDYITRGYVINEKRLKQSQELRLKELQEAHLMIQKALETKRLEGYEKELVNIISDYTNTWVLLHKYDQDDLKIPDAGKRKIKYLDYDKIQKGIERFKKRLVGQNEAGDLFGKENADKLSGILKSVEQGFGGSELYPSVEEKAAHLLYFIIKDHPFFDGNKRIGSLLFILFLIENGYLYNKKGERKINDNALTALALLIAESDPKQKDTMVRLVVNLISK